MKKYLIIFISAFILELVTTMYISGVAEKNMLQTLFFAFISPFVSLPFVVYIIESKTMLDRVKMALCSGSGYAFGVYVVMFYLNN
jgi:hypothetical protein